MAQRRPAPLRPAPLRPYSPQAYTKPAKPPLIDYGDTRKYDLTYRISGRSYQASILAQSPEAAIDRVKRHISGAEQIEVKSDYPH